MSIYKAYGYLIQEAIKPDDRLNPLINEIMKFVMDNIKTEDVIYDPSKEKNFKYRDYKTSVDGEFTMIDGKPLLFRMVPCRFAEPEELGSYTSPDDNNGKHYIVLTIHREDIEGKSLNQIYTLYKKVVTHELFHAVQYMNKSGTGESMKSMKYASPDKDFYGYLRSDKEVHAEFGAMIHRLVGWYKLQKKLGTNIPQTELWERAKGVLSTRVTKGLPDYTIEKLKRAFFRQVQQIEGK